MNQRSERLAQDAARHDIDVGTLGALGMACLRILALAAIAFGTAPFRWAFSGQLLVELVLIVFLTLRMRRGHRWAAIGLAILYGLGYVYSWLVSGRALPPLALIGVLVWYALYRGIRGTSALTSRSRDHAPAA